MLQHWLFSIGIFCALIPRIGNAQTGAANLPTHSEPGSRIITVDLERPGAPLTPFWAYFGCDEPNYTYGNDGRKLLDELSALSPVPVYMRVHNLLTTGDGRPALKWGSTNAYTEDAAGKPVYDWTILDSIFDAFIQRGIRPIAEVGFMPEALSTHPEPYRHHWQPGASYNEIYTGWAYPPKDYARWGELVYQWVRHCVARYGAGQVRTWWWEVWNEPNIGYWKGTPEEYNCLYDYTADAVKRACPGARVGGPASTGPGWKDAGEYLRRFLTHCHSGKNYVTGKSGTPLDFISFHAKGNPRITVGHTETTGGREEMSGGHVQMNMAPELTDLATGFGIVAGSPYAALPVLVTECDPEGCAACSMATSPQNAYRNGTMYSSYTAATFARIYDLAERYHVRLEGATTWAFTFEGQRWFDGFRDLATNGVDKPVMGMFRMLGMMNGRPGDVSRRVGVQYGSGAQAELEIPLDSLLHNSVRGAQPDIHALASETDHSANVLLWNYHDDEIKKDTVRLSLLLKHIPADRVEVLEYRIDRDHSNAYEAWKRMGSPAAPSPEQYALLEQAGQLQLIEAPVPVPVQGGALKLEMALPAQAACFVRVEYVRAPGANAARASATPRGAVTPSAVPRGAAPPSAVPRGAAPPSATGLPDLSGIYFIDTHNDILSKQIVGGQNLALEQPGLALDLPKARKGHLAAQEFSIWCDEVYGKGQAFAMANREIDSLYALIRRNPDKITLVRTATELEAVMKTGRLGALIGVEGGHMIEDRMDYLDSLAKRGMSYLTLTWNNSTSWATSARDETLKRDSLPHLGLTDKGRAIVHRLNDLGIMVDVSHVGDRTFYDVLATSRKPVIASHSCAYALNPFRRNLKDDQLKAIAKNGGVVFVNFYSGFVDSAYYPRQAVFLSAHRHELDSLTTLLKDPDEATDSLYALYPAAAAALRPPLSLLVQHIDYIARLIGVDHVGIGADFSGAESYPQTMEDVRDYPKISAALYRLGYSRGDIQKIAGGNFLRVLRANRP
jgi:xylan 1,4-beta-xylosidase